MGWTGKLQALASERLFDLRIQFVLLVLLPSGGYLVPALIDDGKIGQISPYAALGAFLLFGGLFWGACRRRRRLIRNRDEQAVFRGRYILLLRSFSNTEGYQTHARVVQTEGMTSPYEESIVGELDAAVRRLDARLVVLGGELILPGDQGVFWLRCDDRHWRDTLGKLALGAWGLIVIPETTQGIADELAFVQHHGLTSRCLFLMYPQPPAQSGLVDYPSASAKAEQWAELQVKTRQVGLHFPDYDPRGALFRIGDGGRAGDIQPLQGEGGLVKKLLLSVEGTRGRSGQRAALAGAMRRLLAQGGADGRPFAEVFPNLQLTKEDLGQHLLFALPGSGSLYASSLAIVGLGALPLICLAIHPAVLIAFIVLTLGWGLSDWVKGRLKG